MTIEEYSQIVFNTYLDIKEGIIGEYKLEKAILAKGYEFTIIPDNFQSLLLGLSPKKIELQKEYAYYDLFKSNLRIMSNSPGIMADQYLPFIKSKGKVLLGGLGIGIVPLMMCNKENIESVTVVEISKEVIELCGVSNRKLEIVNDDFYSFLRKENLNNYDYIYTDAYTSEGDAYSDVIIPTRKFLYKNYPSIPVDFWNEDQLKVNYIININSVK